MLDSSHSMYSYVSLWVSSQDLNVLIIYKVVLRYANMNYLTRQPTWFSPSSSPLSLGIFSVCPPSTLLQSNTLSPNLKSPLKAASFSQCSLCWIIWGSAGFWVFHSVFLPQVFLPLYRFSPFKLHPCVLCGFSLPLPLYVRLREIRGLSSDGCLMRSRHARRGTEGAYEVHEAFSLAIATLHLLSHFYPKPS